MINQFGKQNILWTKFFQRRQMSLSWKKSLHFIIDRSILNIYIISSIYNFNCKVSLGKGVWKIFWFWFQVASMSVQVFTVPTLVSMLPSISSYYHTTYLRASWFALLFFHFFNDLKVKVTISTSDSKIVDTCVAYFVLSTNLVNIVFFSWHSRL